MVFMSEGKRSRLSLTQRTEIWSRWKSGQSLHEIGRAYGKPHSCIRCLLLPRGRIPPIARRRSRLALTRSEREDISRGIASGSSIREMARHLDRAASTVCREVTRHGGRPAYRAHEADDRAWESALRPKKCLLALHRSALPAEVENHAEIRFGRYLRPTRHRTQPMIVSTRISY
jgi:IS30 family transposase